MKLYTKKYPCYNSHSTVSTGKEGKNNHDKKQQKTTIITLVQEKYTAIQVSHEAQIIKKV